MNTPNINTDRVGSGNPHGGEWTNRVHPVPSATLPSDTVDTTNQDLKQIARELYDASSIDREHLGSYVHHQSGDVRCEALRNPHITTDEIEQLAHDDDPKVRWAVANLPYRNAPDFVARDTNVIIRAAAYQNQSLSAENRAFLHDDSEVQRTLSMYGPTLEPLAN